jgi:hypothetical protein
MRVPSPVSGAIGTVAPAASRALSAVPTGAGSLASVSRMAGVYIGRGGGRGGTSGAPGIGWRGSFRGGTGGAPSASLMNASAFGPAVVGPGAVGAALAYASGQAAGLAAMLAQLAPAFSLAPLSAIAGPTYGVSGAGRTGGFAGARGNAPAPAPLQGVSAPASAGASSGVGFSLFAMLAGLLVLGALLVSGRLRLSSQLWRPAPFVLNLERPG